MTPNQRRLQHHDLYVLRSESAFDVAAFEAITYTEPTSTERIPVDENEYPAVLDKYEFRPTPSKDGTKHYLFFDVMWSLDSPEQKAKLKRDKILVRQSMSLERDPATGAMAGGEGINVEFGKLRDALGLNRKGQPFKFADLIGRPAKVKVKHRTFKNAADEDETSAEVRAVAPL